MQDGKQLTDRLRPFVLRRAPKAEICEQVTAQMVDILVNQRGRGFSDAEIVRAVARALRLGADPDAHLGVHLEWVSPVALTLGYASMALGQDRRDWAELAVELALFGGRVDAYDCLRAAQIEACIRDELSRESVAASEVA